VLIISELSDLFGLCYSLSCCKYTLFTRIRR